jgi:hypothetical protein
VGSSVSLVSNGFVPPCVLGGHLDVRRRWARSLACSQTSTRSRPPPFARYRATSCAVQGHVRAAKHLRPSGFARLPHRDAHAHSQGYALVALNQNKVRNGCAQQLRNPAGCREGVVREQHHELFSAQASNGMPRRLGLAEQEVADHPQDMVAKGMPLGIALPGKVGSSGVRPSSWCLSLSGPA